MKQTYHIVRRDAQASAAIVEEFTRANGQFLLPLLDLIREARIAVDRVIDEVGRKTIETVLTLSAEQVASRVHQASLAAKFSGRIAAWTSEARRTPA